MGGADGIMNSLKMTGKARIIEGPASAKLGVFCRANLLAMESFGMWSRTRTHKLLKMLTFQSNPIQVDAARTANSSQATIVTMEVSICRKKGMLTATTRSSGKEMVGIREERAARNIIISPCNGKRRPRSRGQKDPNWPQQMAMILEIEN